jgi:hypothetical protein
MSIVCFCRIRFIFFNFTFFIIILYFRAMPPPHGENDVNQKVNIRINDVTANNIHKAAVTRDYIKQPRLSKNNKIRHISKFNYLFFSI